LVLLYAVDYVLLRFHGQALGSVDVQIMWAIKQKDNRIDYELGDTETRPCVHSLFPQMGYAPCWYLSRHKNQTITVGSIPRRFADVAQTLQSAGRPPGRRLFSAGKSACATLRGAIPS
jgi:hypothetical protein